MNWPNEMATMLAMCAMQCKHSPWFVFMFGTFGIERPPVGSKRKWRTATATTTTTTRPRCDTLRDKKNVEQRTGATHGSAPADAIELS